MGQHSLWLFGTSMDYKDIYLSLIFRRSLEEMKFVVDMQDFRIEWVYFRTDWVFAGVCGSRMISIALLRAQNHLRSPNPGSPNGTCCILLCGTGCFPHQLGMGILW